MHIIMTAMMDLSINGGFTGLLDYQATLLRDAGHDVIVVGMTSGEPVLAAPNLTVQGRCDALLQARTAFEIVRTVEHKRPDLAILTQVGAPLVAPIALTLRKLGVPLIYDCMDPVIEVLRNSLGPSPLFFALRPWLVISHHMLDRCVAATLSVSPGLDSILRRRGWRGPILRFYNIHGTQLTGQPGRSGIRSGDWESATILVYAGGLQPRFRGIEDQIRAVAIANRQGARIRFLIVGYGDPDPFLRIAQECGLHDCVRALPHVAPRELADILADCDVAVSNSLHYALPSKIFEYLNHGIHILSIDDGNDVNMLCRDFVEIYDGSIEGMASALVRCSRRMPAARQLENARRFLAGLRTESAVSLFSSIDRAMSRRSRVSAKEHLAPQLKIEQGPNQ